MPERTGHIAATLLMLLSAGAALGQAGLRAPGQSVIPGANSDFGSNRFIRNSYGMGGLNTARTTAGGDLLRKSAGYTISRPGASTSTALSGLQGMGASPTASSKVIYRPATPMLTAPDPTGSARVGGIGSKLPAVPPMARTDQAGAGAASVTDPASASQAGRLSRVDMLVAPNLMEALGVSRGEQAQPSEPVITLVGEGEGRFTDYMRAGDRALRAGQYELAAEQFGLAYTLGDDSPEAMLCLLHANLGLGRYASASFYLRRAVSYLPELPLTGLALSDLFGGPGQLSAVRVGLQERIQTSGDDPESWFLKAYVDWFHRSDVEAEQSLRKALTLSRDDKLIEAINTFWQVAASTGRIAPPPPRQPTSVSGGPALGPAGTP